MRRSVLPALAAAASLTVLGAGLTPAVAVTGTPASGSAAGIARPGDLQTVRAKHTSGGVVWGGASSGRTSSPSLRANAVATADIRVTYSAGFTPSAQAAFQAAVDVWKTQIRSSVPITIDAQWTPLQAGVLGQAGPTNFRRDFAGAPRPNTYYPDALANAVAGRDLDPSQPEIQARFNSAFPAWYLGTDGRPGTSLYDFESVVLHELGHGLGLVGTFDGMSPPTWTDTGRGYWGLDRPGDLPTVFDRMITDGAGRDGLDTAVYPQGSTALGGMLRGASGGAQWKGGAGVIAANGARPRLYSPSSFEEGSSISHLDESAYPAGSANALMTPYLQNGESVHDPGPIVRGMFTDMGWGATTPCTAATGTSTDRFVASGPTRRGTVAMNAGIAYELPVAGTAGVPSSGVSSVLVTVEISRPSASGYLLLGSACGGGTSSAQQYSAGVSKSVLLAVPLDSLGRMQLKLSAGAAVVAVNVNGWYGTGSTSGLYAPIARTRASGTVVRAGAPIDVPTSIGGVPASGVDAVLLQVTVQNPTATGTLAVGPGGINPALASQWYVAGRSVTQLVVARRSADGKVRVALSAGSAPVLVDVWGYYGAAAGGQVHHGVTPTRVLPGTTSPDVTFVVPNLPAGTRTVALLTTVVAPTATGYLAAGPGNSSAGLAGVLQFSANVSGANLVVLPVGAGNTVHLKLSAGTGRIYADLIGYHGTS